MTEEKKGPGLVEKIMDGADVIARYAQVPWVRALQGGMVATTAPILIGSIFLILSLMGTPGSFGDANSPALLPFLSPYATLLANVNNMTLGFVGFWAAYSIAKSYGDILSVDSTQSGLLGLLAFFFITFTGPEDATISTAYFGTNGLFVSMITSLLSVKVYSIFIKKNFTIRLPDSVPPNVGNSFAMLVPMAVIIIVCWFIRSIIGFDFPGFLTNFLTPFLHGADTIWSFAFFTFLAVALWSVGLNGPGILGPIITPIYTANLMSNTEALLAGEQLTHIWTNSFQFSFIWVGSVFPIVILYILSKNKGKRTLGIAAAPSLIFNIIEPTMFGSPVVMNPTLMIPFIINGVLGPVIGYLSVMIGFVAHPFAEVPWATPPFISGVLITGDWKILIVQALVLMLGIVIYLPFIRKDIADSEAQAAEACAEVE